MEDTRNMNLCLCLENNKKGDWTMNGLDDIKTIHFEPGMDMYDVTAAIYFHIDAIKNTDDVETIKVCLECIYDLFCGSFDTNKEEIIEYIKDGVGIFGEIRKKCMGLWVL